MTDRLSKAEEARQTSVFLDILKNYYPQIIEQNYKQSPLWNTVLQECQDLGIFMDKTAEYLVRKRWPASVGAVKKTTNRGRPLTDKDKLIIEIERSRHPDFCYGLLEGDVVDDQEQNLTTDEDVPPADDQDEQNLATDEDGPPVDDQEAQNLATNEDGSQAGDQEEQNLATDEDGPPADDQEEQNLATDEDGPPADDQEDRNLTTNEDQFDTASLYSIEGQPGTVNDEDQSDGISNAPASPIQLDYSYLAPGGVNPQPLQINNGALPHNLSINDIITEPNDNLRDEYFRAATRALNSYSDLLQLKMQIMLGRN